MTKLEIASRIRAEIKEITKEQNKIKIPKSGGTRDPQLLTHLISRKHTLREVLNLLK